MSAYVNFTHGNPSTRDLNTPTLDVPTSRATPSSLLPAFLLVGCMKCGSTSLFRYMTKHPVVIGPNCTIARTTGSLCWLDKEAHYFDDFETFQRGLDYYASLFRVPAASNIQHIDTFVAGEGTVNYMVSPSAIALIVRALPGIKIIMVLREPASRAFSQFRFFVKLRSHGWPVPILGPPWPTFDKQPGVVYALTVLRNGYNASIEPHSPRDETAMLHCLLRGASDNWERCCKSSVVDDRHQLTIATGLPTCWYGLLTGYVSLGLYAPQLRMWLSRLPKPSSQLLVLRSENLFADAPRLLRERIQPFLGLPDDGGVWDSERLNVIRTNAGGDMDKKKFTADQELTPADFEATGMRYIAHPRKPVPAVTNEELRASRELKAFFVPWNKQLYKILDDPSFGTWERQRMMLGKKKRI